MKKKYIRKKIKKNGEKSTGKKVRPKVNLFKAKED
jgi:hypothetical protein